MRADVANILKWGQRIGPREKQNWVIARRLPISELCLASGTRLGGCQTASFLRPPIGGVPECGSAPPPPGKGQGKLFKGVFFMRFFFTAQPNPSGVLKQSSGPYPINFDDIN